MKILQPPGWPRPKGYSNGISASGRLVVTGGIVGWNEQEEFPHKDMAGQARVTFENIAAVLASCGLEHHAKRFEDDESLRAMSDGRCPYRQDAVTGKVSSKTLPSVSTAFTWKGSALSPA